MLLIEDDGTVVEAIQLLENFDRTELVDAWDDFGLRYAVKDDEVLDAWARGETTLDHPIVLLEGYHKVPQ
jgi:hypothetical protein